MASTRMRAPGASLAMRVALVMPLYRTSTLVNPWRRHTRHRTPEQSDLTLQLAQVRSLSAGRGDPKFGRINLAEICHAGVSYSILTLRNRKRETQLVR